MTVATIVDLGKSYGSKRALDGLTVEFPGGAMGLLGPNGAGKTTLLKTLLGLLRADRGSATVLGIDTSRAPLDLRRRVGYMPESDCWIPRMKGVRLVAFAGQLAGLPRKPALTRAHEVLFYVGLGEARYRIVDQYSQGMRQRMRLAQALVHDPELLFLDEPTSGLDPAGRREMLDLIGDLAANHGKHVVLSSHLLPDVEAVCSHAVVLNEGRVAAQGEIAALRGASEGLCEARIVGDVEAVVGGLRAAGADVRQVLGDRITALLPAGPLTMFRAARDAKSQVRELREVSTTLEEAFLRALESGGPG